jgi:hypothetical protein
VGIQAFASELLIRVMRSEHRGEHGRRDDQHHHDGADPERGVAAKRAPDPRAARVFRDLMVDDDHGGLSRHGTSRLRGRNQAWRARSHDAEPGNDGARQ